MAAVISKVQGLNKYFIVVIEAMLKYITELRCIAWSHTLSLAYLVAVYEGEWQFSAVYIAIFDASFIIPVFLYKLFFVLLLAIDDV